MLLPIDIIFDSDQVSESANVTGTKDSPIFTIMPSLEDCVGVAVTYANVPFTYFVIDGTNNTFTVTIDTGAPVPINVTLEEGTYNVVNIVTQLKSKIDEVTAWSSTDYELFIDSTTSKLVVYKLTNTSTPFSLDFSANSLGKILGFERASYTSSNNVVLDDADTLLTARQNIKAPRVINLSGPAQMFLDSSLGSAVYGSVRNQDSSRALLGFWPVNSNYQGTIEYLNPNPEMIPLTKTQVSKITLGLTVGNTSSYMVSGSQSQFLPLNGEPFQVGLRFWKEVTDNHRERDDLGNISTSVRDMSGSIFRPQKKPKTLR